MKRPFAIVLACLALGIPLLGLGVQGARVTAQANGQDLVLVVQTGSRIHFQGHIEASLMDQVSSYGWNFSRADYDRSGQLSLNHTFFAKGPYNATFWVLLENGDRLEHTLRVYVYFDEQEASRLSFLSAFPPWLYTLLASLEIVIGLSLFGATWHLKRAKIYLREPTRLDL